MKTTEPEVSEETGSREEALANGRALLAHAPARALDQAEFMLQVDARDPDAMRLAAAACRALDREREAETFERQAIENWEQTPELRTAADALSKGDPAQAEALVRRRLDAHPDDLGALSMLATIAARAGALADAEQMNKAVLRQAPGFIPARIELLRLLDDDTRFAEALEQVKQLQQLDTGNYRWRHHEMTLLVRMGRFAEALAISEELLAQRPDDLSLLVSKGNILKTLGKTEESIAVFRDCVIADPGFGEAWWSLANMKTYRFEPSEIESMQEQLSQPLDNKKRTNLLFALGTAMEVTEQADRAFGYYSQANETWHAEHGHKPERIDRIVDEIVAGTDAGWFDRQVLPQDNSACPIFVVGMPRAGSTLVEQILSSHTQIEGTAELPYIPAIARSIGFHMREESSMAALSQLDTEQRKAWGDEYLARATEHQVEECRYFIDKTPNNWMFVPLIRTILPNARIIDARRDAMACCFSNFKQHFARGQMFTYSLEDLGRYYRNYVRQMEHFDAIAPGFVHRVSYEELVRQPEREIRALLTYLGLDFEEACLNFHENRRAVRTASAEQVRRPLDTSTNDAWKPFSPYLDPLRAALGDLADRNPAGSSS